MYSETDVIWTKCPDFLGHFMHSLGLSFSIQISQVSLLIGLIIIPLTSDINVYSLKLCILHPYNSRSHM